MNRRRIAFLAPLFAVLAMLCTLTETASAAFNPAAQNPHYGNFLLRESEASASEWLQLADPIKENGEWIYDGALGVPVYVRQNPWTMFDPLGLREANETEKAGLKKMDEVASSIRDEATKLDEKGKTESPVKGDPFGMTESQLEANRLRGEAGEINGSARMIKEAIDALGEGEMSNRMAYVNEAFGIWTNSERSDQFLPGGSVRWSGDGVFGDNNKCNIFLYLCLRASNPASRLTFGGKGKDAFNAGYWANDKNNPGGLFPPAAILDGERNTILINNGDPGLGGANYTAQPGDVLSFGAANAGQDGAHVALSLGGNTMINGSYSPPGGRWPAQQPSVNIKLLNSQEGRRRVIRQSK